LAAAAVTDTSTSTSTSTISRLCRTVTVRGFCLARRCSAAAAAAAAVPERYLRVTKALNFL
jgi:DNA-binding MurR/RpiR family transcriptional regulator